MLVHRLSIRQTGRNQRLECACVCVRVCMSVYLGVRTETRSITRRGLKRVGRVWKSITLQHFVYMAKVCHFAICRCCCRAISMCVCVQGHPENWQHEWDIFTWWMARHWRQTFPTSAGVCTKVNWGSRAFGLFCDHFIVGVNLQNTLKGLKLKEQL